MRQAPEAGWAGREPRQDNSCGKQTHTSCAHPVQKTTETKEEKRAPAPYAQQMAGKE